MIDRDFLTLLFMAVKTQGIAFFESKFWVFRSMGLMARIAHSLFKGGVIYSPTCLQLRGVMTIVAKLTSFF
jgi:hypothetical protein